MPQLQPYVISEHSIFIILLILQMSYEEPNLMNFLKSTALKAKSSAANTKKMGSSQFDNLNYDNLTTNTFNTFQQKYTESPVRQLNLFQSNYNNNAHQPSNTSPTKQPTDFNAFNNFSFFNSKANSSPQFNSQFNSNNNNSVQSTGYFNNPEIFAKKTNSFIKQQTSSFSSARQQTTELLQTISKNLGKQITNVDAKIYSFSRSLDLTLQDFFKTIKRQLYEIVQEAVILGMRQSQQYKKLKEQKYVGELYRVKDTLQKEYAKIQMMKSDMKTQRWRKTAGEIIANDIQQKHYDFIQRSSMVEARRWEPPNLMPQLKEVQRKLIESLSLK